MGKGARELRESGGREFENSGEKDEIGESVEM